MNYSTISQEDAIRLQFRSNTKIGDVTFFSGFMAAVRDARKATLRDEDTGEKNLMPTMVHGLVLWVTWLH